MKAADPKTTAGRAFVRSLNILLKFARLYGDDHARTTEQLNIAFQELRTAVPAGSETALLLGATGAQLLLDGVPLEGSPAEKQFAQLLSAAGLASVQFFASITEEELSRFARSFPTGKAKLAELAQQLKLALDGAQGIRVNEICFVATDARLKDASMAAQLAAASLGEEHAQFKQWLNDPQKLLELIAAPQGANSGGSQTNGAGEAASGAAIGTGIDSRGSQPRSASQVGGSGPSPSAMTSAVIAGAGLSSDASRGFVQPTEDEIHGIRRALASIGQVATGAGSGVTAAGAFHEQMSQLPGRTQDTLKAALAELASHAPDSKPDESVLVQLAEHLAIRYALDRYEKGEVKVNAVRQMLDRMNQEIGSLRKILGAHEETMSEAGLLVESHREILDRQFWTPDGCAPFCRKAAWTKPTSRWRRLMSPPTASLCARGGTSVYG